MDTLGQHLIKQNCDRSLVSVIVAISLACKNISINIRKAGLLDLHGSHQTENSSGDQVKKLDMLSHDVFVNALSRTGLVSMMVSEEAEEAIVLGDQGYALVFDPLDGSSNIDCNISTGSIFGIYPDRNIGPGNQLIGAGYCMYGSSTQLVITLGNGVQQYLLDPELGEFIMTHENMCIPDSPKKIYSVNEANSKNWAPAMVQFVDHCKDNGYTQRYVGSMVSDVHRTILYGGMFSYPSDQKNPNGKLRLLYECNPMAMLITQAGGRATTDDGLDIMSLPSESLHGRKSIVLGCQRDMDLYLAGLESETM